MFLEDHRSMDLSVVVHSISSKAVKRVISCSKLCHVRCPASGVLVGGSIALPSDETSSMVLNLHAINERVMENEG